MELLLFTPEGLNKRKLGMRAKGKTILITGASFGIGESLAYQLAAAGAQVVLVARTAEKLTEIKKTIEDKGGVAAIYPADLRDSRETAALLAWLHSLPGGVDIVVNNAGISIRRPIAESLDRHHDFARTMAINYFGPVQLMLSLLPVLQKSQGHIINISSASVLLAPAPCWAAYQASKSAFDQWFRCAAPELNAAGIATTSVYLPLVKTRMIAPTAGYRNMPAMSPQHVAAVVCGCIISRRGRYAPWWLIFGQLASVLFGNAWNTINTRKRKKKNAESTAEAI